MCPDPQQPRTRQRFCKNPEGFHDAPEPLPPGTAWFTENARDESLYPSPVCGECAGFLMADSDYEEYLGSGGDGSYVESVVRYVRERIRGDDEDDE